MKVLRLALLLLFCAAFLVNALESEDSDKKTATVWVNCSPEGADIFVDDAFVGNAPAVLKIEAGKHEIRISLNGYEDWKRPVDILADSELTLSPTLTKKQNSTTPAWNPESPRPGIQFDTATRLEGKQFYILPPAYVRLTSRDPMLHFDETKGKYYTLHAPSGFIYEFRDYNESKGRFGKIYRELIAIRDVDWTGKTATLIVDAVNKPKRSGVVHFRFSSDKVFWKLFNQCFATSLP
ncbi:PEGA domain-containing protein [bacterium]|nr:PEGA domain-containing protein [bacterium]